MPRNLPLLIAALVLSPLACSPPADGGAGEAEGENPTFAPGDEIEIFSDAGWVAGGLAVFVEDTDGTREPAVWRGPRRLLDVYADSLTGGTYIFPLDARVPRIRLLVAGERVVRAGDRPIEAVSLLGEPLRRPEITGETLAAYEANLESARAERDANPGDPEAWIWVGRRLAYLGRYGEAIAIFTEGRERWPEDPRFLRHRGHRYITTRRLEEAERDLENARGLVDLSRMLDEAEPDGLPNAAGIHP